MRNFKRHPFISLLYGYLVDCPQPSNGNYMWYFASLLGFLALSLFGIAVLYLFGDLFLNQAIYCTDGLQGAGKAYLDKVFHLNQDIVYGKDQVGLYKEMFKELAVSKIDMSQQEYLSKFNELSNGLRESQTNVDSHIKRLDGLQNNPSTLSESTSSVKRSLEDAGSSSSSSKRPSK